MIPSPSGVSCAMFGKFPAADLASDASIVQKHGDDLGFSYNFRQEIGFLAGFTPAISLVYAGIMHTIPALGEHRPVLQVAKIIGGKNFAAHFAESNLQNFAISAAIMTVLVAAAEFSMLFIPAWRKKLEKDRLKMWVKIGKFEENQPPLTDGVLYPRDVHRGFLAAARLKELEGRKI